MDVDDYVKRGRIINALAHRECGNDEYDIAVNDCIEIAKQVPADAGESRDASGTAFSGAERCHWLSVENLTHRVP